jgi:myxalamid-type polyketide synthase MxaE and MxaD
MDDTFNRIADLSPEKRALLAKRVRSASNATQLLVSEPIAVIGLGCRFPGRANDPDAFWQLLRDGVDAITEVPTDRWDVNALYDPNPETPGKVSTRWGGFIQHIDLFDPGFFGISPRETLSMDPQQRLLLEVAWEALEHAGQPIDQLAGSQTGVFVGASGSEYGLLQGADNDSIDTYTGTGSAVNIIAGRLSYLLDLRGPCVTVDTACSSSLVAVHLACQSLHLGECRLAIAGGVNLLLSPRSTINMSKMRMMASDGRCKTFDALANGFVRGEGCGVVVLKRLSDALADGDPVLALVRGSAINQDGRSSGLTAPNVLAQQAVIREALANAGLTPSQISYVETHGTGTALGDPIEVEALAEVIGRQQSDALPCVLGAVKTNIGHLEPAAGIAGFIKVVLALQHEVIPANLHLQTLNPHIALDGTRFVIPTTPQPWPAGARRRYAGLSSFGWSGTNAHMVLEEAPRSGTAEPAATPAVDGQAYLLPLSARSPAALVALATSYHAMLSASSTPSLHDLTYTASLRRAHHEHRLAIVGDSAATMADQVLAFLHGEPRPGIAAGQLLASQPPKLAFVFAGQGAQWIGVGRQLLAHEPVFRAQIEQCDSLLRPYTGWSLLEELLKDEAQSRLEESEIAQPAIFALQIALAALWDSWGIRPSAVVGHSIGEVAAAYVAGVLSLEDAVRVVAYRGRLMQRTSGSGQMVMVSLPRDRAAELCRAYAGRVEISAVNSPLETVLGGHADAIADLCAVLQQQQVFHRVLHVPYASHTAHMEPIQAEFVQALRGITPQAANLPIFSTVTGRLGSAGDFDAVYWGRNIREPVQFVGATDALLQAGYRVFLEINAHPVLMHALTENLRSQGQTGTIVASLRRDLPERAGLLQALAVLYAQGYAIDWRAVYPVPGRCVSLPSYPWQRERYWPDPLINRQVRSSSQSQGLLRRATDHPLLGMRISPATQPGTHYWEGVLSLATLPYLVDHQVEGLVVVPGAAYLEFVLAAARSLFGPGAYTLEQVVFTRMLILEEQAEQTLQLTLTTGAYDETRFEIHSRPVDSTAADGTWTLHATGNIRPSRSGVEQVALSEIQARCAEPIAAESYYERLTVQGLNYGPSFRGIAEVWRRDGEALVRLVPPAGIVAELGTYQIHPVLLDACFQTFEATLPQANTSGRAVNATVLAGVQSLCWHSSPRAHGELWTHARLRQDTTSDTLECDFSLLDEHGQVLLEVQGLGIQHLERDPGSSKQDHIDSWLYTVRWERQDRALQAEATADRSPARRPGSWLLFADTSEIGLRVADRLAACGERCIIVTPGERYQLVDGVYQLNLTDAEGFKRLLKDAFKADEPACRGIIHLWSLDAPSSTDMTLEALTGAQNLVSHSVLYLIQALAYIGWRDVPRLWLVTRGVQVMDDTVGEGSVAQAPLWGLSRVINHEYPQLSCTNIDLNAEPLVEEAQALFAEVWTADQEDQVALRADGRYVARLMRASSKDFAPAAAVARHSDPDVRLVRPDGTYLITGGLGGIGLVVAQWLVDHGARSLVLIGRHAPGPTVHAQLAALSAAGAAVQVALLDVADHAALAALLADIAATRPPLRGVFHAAGILDDGVLLHQTAERFRAVCAPKLAGAWNLHLLTQALPLDWFVLCSSVAALLGSPGQSNYAAANTFLDALAHYRRARDLPALSINWGPWADVGLAAAQANRGERLAYQGMGSLSPEHGLAALERLLVAAPPQVAVVPLNLRQWQQYYPKAAAAPLLSYLMEEHAAERLQGAGTLRAALMAAEPEQRLPLLETHLYEVICRIMRLPRARLDRHTPLGSIGLDSLMALEFRNSLENSLELRFPVTLIWNYQSIADLAAHLAEKLNLTVTSMEQAPAPTVSSDQSMELAAFLSELTSFSVEELQQTLATESSTKGNLDG